MYHSSYLIEQLRETTSLLNILKVNVKSCFARLFWYSKLFYEMNFMKFFCVSFLTNMIYHSMKMRFHFYFMKQN